MENSESLQIQTEKVLASLSPQNRVVFDKFKKLEQGRNEGAEQARKYAIEQLRANEEPTALTDRDEGTEMYELQTGFDEKVFLFQRIKGKVLDIGSGGKNELKDVVSDEQFVYLDKKRYQQGNFVQADASNLPFTDKTFDTIYSSRLAIDYQSAKQFIPEMLRVVKPGGVVILRPHNDSESILEILVALSELGIDIGKQCELTLAKVSLKHKTLPISIDRSGVYITVRLGESEKG